jgi:hypothetical protein
MPDITIVCKECGREHKISEYAKIEKMNCAGCSQPLEMPRKAAAQAGISVRQGPPKVPDKMPDAPKVVVESDTVSTSKVHDKEVELSKPPLWQAVVCFGAVAGIMGYFLMHWQQYQGYLQYYLWARNILALGTIVLILVIAYHDAIGHGAVCLVFPPYMLWYAWTRLESYALRGLFFGIIAVLAAEVYYMPEYSVGLKIQEIAGNLVTTVDGLIERAAE